MRFLIVYDLADTSTRDVGDGVRDGLVALGHDVSIVPVNVYSQLLLHKWKDDVASLPPNIMGLIAGAIGKLILADIVLQSPDVVYVISGWAMPPEIVQFAQAQGSKVILHLLDAPYMDHKQPELCGPYDVILVNERASVDFYRTYNQNVHYMPHCWNPNQHTADQGSPEDCPDVFMCATGFDERVRVLERVRWNGHKLVLKGFWPRPGSLGPYIKEGTVQNRVLPVYYKNSKVNLNIHRTSRQWHPDTGSQGHVDTQMESVGPRVVEVLACGGFLMTDFREECDEFAGGLVVFDEDNLQERLDHFLAHPAERAEIARRGHVLVQPWTFESRLRKITLPLCCGAHNRNNIGG
jgi:hypothetical protein